MKPAVSVIVPFYNRLTEISAALRSLDAQTFQDWELVIVDDASRDDPTRQLHEMLPGRNLRVIRHRDNRGPSAARNTGIDSAKGDFVAFLDSDDCWLPEKLETQMSKLDRETQPEFVFSITRTQVLMGHDIVRQLPRRPLHPGENPSEFLYVEHGFAQTSSFLLHRAAAGRIRFAEHLRQYEDHLFFIAAITHGLRYALCEEVLTVWHNDDRSDRAGRVDNLARAERYLETAGSLLTPRARLAFLTRYLGSTLFWQDPAGSLRLFHEAYRAGAVKPRDLMTLALRCSMPARQYASLRQAVLTGGRLFSARGVNGAYAFGSSGAAGEATAGPGSE